MIFFGPIFLSTAFHILLQKILYQSCILFSLIIQVFVMRERQIQQRELYQSEMLFYLVQCLFYLLIIFLGANVQFVGLIWLLKVFLKHGFAQNHPFVPVRGL